MDINILDDVIIIELIKLIFLETCTSIVFFKIINYKVKKIDFFYLITIILISTIVLYIRYIINYSIGVISMIFLVSCLCSKITKEDIGLSIIIIIISQTINYIFQFIEIFIVFLINRIIHIENDYYNLMIMLFLHLIFIIQLNKNRRIKNGISYLREKNSNDVLNITIINISIVIFASIIFFSEGSKYIGLTKKIIVGFIIFSMTLFFTIKKSIEVYYKQKLLIQDLNETKKELEDKKKEVEELEAENLRFSKKAHSLAHKQKSLEFKINKILMNYEIAEEIALQSELKNISKQLLENNKLPKLDKTRISEIDDMLDVMQEECRLNGIDFVLQLKGNIYQMINHYITKEELAILLADHIKDAIIAINHSDNINKSIMVRLGKIEDCFAVYFYDSGVEFSKKVFDNLGKKPVTMYPNEGGTGMGFMNTFDLLNKYSASLIIENIGKPSKDNYTKVIKIKFDNKKDLSFDTNSFSYKH